MAIELDPFERSVMLLCITEQVIKQRRLIEQACGYSEDYGNDHILIKSITTHLKSPEIKPIATRINEILEMHNAQQKTKGKSDS